MRTSLVALVVVAVSCWHQVNGQSLEEKLRMATNRLQVTENAQLLSRPTYSFAPSQISQRKRLTPRPYAGTID